MKIFIYILLVIHVYNPIYSKIDGGLSNGQLKQYKYLDGLSSNFIFDIEKDKYGRIWAATQNGLTVIDGQNFIKYGINDSLPSSDIIKISFYNENVYVATSTQGVYVFNGESFERLNFVQGKKVNHMNKVGNSLFISTDLENLIYDGTKIEYMGWGFPNGKVVHTSTYNGNTWFAGERNIIEEIGSKFKSYDLTFADETIVIKTILSGDKNIFVGTNNGLYSWSKNQGLELLSKALNVVSLAYFKDDVVIIGTKKGVYTFQKDKAVPLKGNHSLKEIMQNSHIKDIKVVNDHEIWYSTFGQGIIYQDPTSFYNIGKKEGLDVGGMVYNAESYNGSVYIATNNGLYVVQSDYSFKHFDTTDGLPSEKIMDLEIDSAGVVYMATTKGLSIYDGNVFTNFSKKDGLPSNLLLSLLIDQKDKGKVWLGSKSAGLSVFDGESFFTYSKQDGLASNWVQDIKQRKNGTIVLSCYGFGLSFFDGNSFVNYNQGLSDNRVIASVIDQIDRVWVGTESAGLGLFSKNKFEMINSSDGLGHNEIFTLFSDEKNIWAGTFGGGVSYLNEDGWSTINTDDGLIGNTVGAIARLNNNSLVIGCNNGLTIFTPNKTKIQLDIKRIGTPKEDVFLDKTANVKVIGMPGERFSIYINPISYSARDSYFVYKTRIKNGSVFSGWSDLMSSPTIEYKDGYKESMLIHEPIQIGDYVLEIEAINNKLNSSNIIGVPFSIVKAWYLNPVTAIPFWLGILGLGIFSSITFINYRKQKIRNKELQDAETDRQNAELEEAREFQQSLLPDQMPISDNYDIIGFQKTATEVGGDYFDFIEQDNGRIIVICGDATGHGLTSGNVVAITKTALSSIPLDDPISILDTLNKTLLKMNIGLNRMCLNIADLYNDKITFSSAGMPPAYFYSSKDDSLEEILVGALPLGSFSKSIHSAESIPFKNKGDTLILLSDGLPEAENPEGEMIGYEKTEKEIKALIHLSAEDIKEGLVKLCESWLNNADLEDDMTFVIIKKK